MEIEGPHHWYYTLTDEIRMGIISRVRFKRESGRLTYIEEDANVRSSLWNRKANVFGKEPSHDEEHRTYMRVFSHGDSIPYTLDPEEEEEVDLEPDEEDEFDNIEVDWEHYLHTKPTRFQNAR